jgi:WD40 repeat protein
MHKFKYFALLLVLGIFLLLNGSQNSLHAQDRNRGTSFRPSTALFAVRFSPDGQYLARQFGDGHFDVWEMSSNSVIFEYSPPTPTQLWDAALDWSATGGEIAAGIGHSVYVWSIPSGTLRTSFVASMGPDLVYFESGDYLPESIISLEWNSRADTLMSFSLGSFLTVHPFSNRQGYSIGPVSNNPQPYLWSSDDSFVISNFGVNSTSYDLTAQRTLSRHNEMVDYADGTCSVILAAQAARDRRFSIQGTSNGCLLLIEIDSGNQRAVYQVSDSPLMDVSFSPDNAQVAAVDWAGNLHIIDLASGRAVRLVQVEGRLMTVDWAPDNSAIVYGGFSARDEAIFGLIPQSAILTDTAPNRMRPLEVFATAEPEG